MHREREIPDEILSIALQVVRSHTGEVCSDENLDLAADIAAAIMAEQDRCARIVFLAYERKTPICSGIMTKIRNVGAA